MVLARAGHPTVQGALDLETYLALEHILVTGRRRGGGYEDIALGRLGMSRRIRLRCQQHAAACEIVRESDLLATMTRGQAELGNRERGNQMLPFPVQIPPMELFLYWHANVDADPASKWFRGLLLELLRHGRCELTTRQCSASTSRARAAAARRRVCSSSTEMPSGERTNAMWPSRGGRLIVTPCIGEALARRVDVVDLVGEMAEIAPAAVALRVPVVGELDLRLRRRPARRGRRA